MEDLANRHYLVLICNSTVQCSNGDFYLEFSKVAAGKFRVVARSAQLAQNTAARLENNATLSCVANSTFCNEFLVQFLNFL